MGMDFFQMISEVHPSLDDSKGLAKSISNETLDLLVKTINSLQAEKQQRVVKVCSFKEYSNSYANQDRHAIL